MTTLGFSFLTEAVPWGIGEVGLGRLGDLIPFTVRALLYDADVGGKFPVFLGGLDFFPLPPTVCHVEFSSCAFWLGGGDFAVVGLGGRGGNSLSLLVVVVVIFSILRR